jgi:TatD DNase family protein
MIDSHAHLSDFPDPLAVLERARVAGVTGVVNICTDRKTFEKHPNAEGLWRAGATTPHDVDREGEEMFPLFEQAAREGKLVAIGETGLDYHYEHSSKENQKLFLRRYIDLARQFDLPLIFHCRNAFEDLFALADVSRAILHCFTGTVEEAEEVIGRGWYLSLSGIVTFKKSIELQKIAALVPLEQLLIETDSPYLAPQSKRGMQNEPAFLKEIAEKLACLRGVSFETIVSATASNARHIFRL